MQTAEQTLKEEWIKIGDLVFNSLQEPKSWMPGLEKDSGTWNGWLKAVWQTYWTALPIGKTGEDLKKAIVKEGVKEQQKREEEFERWVKTQNKTYRLTEIDNERLDDSLQENSHQKPQSLFQLAEEEFIEAALKVRLRGFSVNVGSWWAHIFDQTRLALTSVKSARSWTLPRP